MRRPNQGHAVFDRIVVISLPRRRDRLREFRARFPSDWVVDVETFAAVDGLDVAPPAWWKTTPGAWGCYLSHRTVLEQALADGVERLLIFEDDATFVDNFAAQMARLRVPDDCQQLYLGGQHLLKPERGPVGLVHGRNVNRTHAYAVFGRDSIDMLCRHLRPAPGIWTADHHVDHHYGILHREGRIRVYAVRPWWCGQAAGVSDVDGNLRLARVW